MSGKGGSAPQYKCSHDGWVSNFKCDLTYCKSQPDKPSGVTGDWKLRKSGTAGQPNTFGAEWEFVCSNGGTNAGSQHKVTCNGKDYSNANLKCVYRETGFWRSMGGSWLGAYKENHNPGYKPSGKSMWGGSCNYRHHSYFGNTCGRTGWRNWGWARYFVGPYCSSNIASISFNQNPKQFPYIYSNVNHVYMSFSYGRGGGGHFRIRWFYTDGSSSTSGWGYYPWDCRWNCRVGNACRNAGCAGGPCCCAAGEARFDNPHRNRMVKYFSLQRSGGSSNIWTISAV